MAGGLLDYVRSGFNNAVNNSPLNPFKPADKALDYANKQMSAAEELAKLQKEGPPNAMQYGTWQDRIATLKAQMAKPAGK